MTRKEWAQKRRTGRPRGWLPDPAQRHAKAVKAGEAARRAHLARALENAADCPSKAAAYAKGYRTGYNRAARHWKRYAQRAIAHALRRPA